MVFNPFTAPSPRLHKHEYAPSPSPLPSLLLIHRPVAPLVHCLVDPLKAANGDSLSRSKNFNGNLNLPASGSRVGHWMAVPVLCTWCFAVKGYSSPFAGPVPPPVPASLPPGLLPPAAAGPGAALPTAHGETRATGEESSSYIK